jgi:hypothetical protein
LNLPVAWKAEPDDATEAYWDAISEELQGSVVAATLNGLPDYVRRHDLPYGIVHELDARTG